MGRRIRGASTPLPSPPHTGLESCSSWSGQGWAGGTWPQAADSPYPTPWAWFRPQLCCSPLTPPRSLGQPLRAQGRGHTATLASEPAPLCVFQGHACLRGHLPVNLIHPHPHQSVQLPPVLETTLAWAESREQQHGGTPDLGSGPRGFPSRPESGDHPSQLAPELPWTYRLPMAVSWAECWNHMSVPRLHPPTETELRGGSNMRPSPCITTQLPSFLSATTA